MGLSQRGIAAELQVSRRQVERVLAQPLESPALLESSPTVADLPEVPALEVPPTPKPPVAEPPRRAPAPVLDAEQRRQAHKAGVEAEAARDCARGYSELRAIGAKFGRQPSPAIQDPAEMLMAAEYNRRHGGRDYSPLRAALRATGRGRRI
jgi:hypothetical protein